MIASQWGRAGGLTEVTAGAVDLEVLVNISQITVAQIALPNEGLSPAAAALALRASAELVPDQAGGRRGSVAPRRVPVPLTAAGVQRALV
jgi:hypothetical protein